MPVQFMNAGRGPAASAGQPAFARGFGGQARTFM